MSWSDTDFQRLDDKLDKLTDAVSRLIIYEHRVDALEKQVMASADEIRAVDKARISDRAEFERWRAYVMGGFAVLAVVAGAAWAVALKFIG